MLGRRPVLVYASVRDMSEVEFQRWSCGPLDPRIHRHGVTADRTWDELGVESSRSEALDIVQSEFDRLEIPNATAHFSDFATHHWTPFVGPDERQRLERREKCGLECVIWLHHRRREFRYKDCSFGTKEWRPPPCDREVLEKLIDERQVGASHREPR